MDLDQAARTLGQTLAASPEFRELTTREKAYAGDAAAQKLVKDAQEAGARLQALQSAGKKIDASEARKLVEMQANLDACTVVQKLVAAQKAYDALVQKVNGMVQKSVEEHRKTT
ncbi:MAG: YlbF family regulator [Planctomycetes bacterium]|nr:YlbF family regulator [Planctomycetota bacterium]